MAFVNLGCFCITPPQFMSEGLWVLKCLTTSPKDNSHLSVFYPLFQQSAGFSQLLSKDETVNKHRRGFLVCVCMCVPVCFHLFIHFPLELAKAFTSFLQFPYSPALFSPLSYPCLLAQLLPRAGPAMQGRSELN